eukprot:10505418-Alexandrium_andersonii.AAC.1
MSSAFLKISPTKPLMAFAPSSLTGAELLSGWHLDWRNFRLALAKQRNSGKSTNARTILRSTPTPRAT